jgi:glutamine synthetase
MSAGISPAVRKRVEALLDRSKAKYVTVAAVDQSAQLRGQVMDRSAFSSCLAGGVPLLPEVMMALDVGDQIFEVPGFLDDDMAFADQAFRIVVDPTRRLPFYPDHASHFFFAECPPENSGHGYDPRVLYRTAEARLDALGLAPFQGVEYEYRIYRETAHSAVAKQFENLIPHTAISGYMNVLQQGNSSDYLFGLLEACETLDVPIAGLHYEHGLGMLEVALGPQRSIVAADNALLFKTFAKIYASRQETLASFMAKPNVEEDGGCMHAHVSLLNRSGRNAFYAAREPHCMSATMRHFIAGVQKLLPDLLLMVAPHANSMRRFVPDHFAPVASTWGIQNRTASIRVVPGSRTGQRIEFRPPGADANTYLVLAFVLSAGAWGIERKLEPGPIEEGNTATRLKRVPKRLRFPATFQEAIERFHGSKVGRELFGDDFVDSYAGARQAQLDALQAHRGKAAWRAERARFLIGA